MMALQAGITPEQYLEQERKAEFKSEYVNGRVYAMSGVSKEHGAIALNIGAELRFQLKSRPCLAFVSDMRVKVNETGKYAYPDVSAVCGESVFEDAVLDTLVNPSVIVEVLSPSTEAYDRGAKFAHYRRIPSLQEYVMVSQSEHSIEKYTRQGEQWALTEYNGLDAVLELTSVDCRIPLREIYDKVKFSNEGESR